MDEADGWQRVGQAITRRIEHELKLTKAEVMRRSGISDKTLDGYMRGEPIRRRDKARDLCLALGWSSDSIALVFEGGEPEPMKPQVSVGQNPLRVRAIWGLDGPELIAYADDPQAIDDLLAQVDPSDREWAKEAVRQVMAGERVIDPGPPDTEIAALRAEIASQRAELEELRSIVARLDNARDEP